MSSLTSLLDSSGNHWAGKLSLLFRDPIHPLMPHLHGSSCYSKGKASKGRAVLMGGDNSLGFGMLRSRPRSTRVHCGVAGVVEEQAWHSTAPLLNRRRVHKSPPLHPISSTNHPRSLPVPNRPSAGSKAANVASVGLLSSLKYVLNLLKIFFILWLFYSHHFGHHLILDVEYQPDPTNKMSKYTFFQSHLGWFSQCSSLPFSSSFHWWPMHRCCEPN